MSVLGGPPAIASVGVELFADALAAQGADVSVIDWRPPAGGAEDALAALALRDADIARANDAALARLNAARPVVAGVGTAGSLVGLEPGTFLHAGPPIAWEAMSGPLRGAIVGAAIYEGIATDYEDADRQARSGAFTFSPCHEHASVGPMAGVVSPSMPMWIVENEAHGNRAYCTFNEGLGKVLRYGAYDTEVIDRLRWIEQVLAPVMTDVLQALDAPLDLRTMTAQALQMGDEGHNRNRAGTSLLLRELLPALLTLDHRPSDEVAAVARFISGNDHFYLNLTMPAGKATADAAAGIADSTIVTAMARNGTEFGLRASGTGDRWFTGASGVIDGLYLPGYGPEDANRDIGDSTITETIGLGGFAMAAAPAIVAFVGGSADDALTATRDMYDISWGESTGYQIPSLGFRGSPLGIDVREVVHTGVLPFVNTGIAHREPGIGQIGAGVVEPPMEAFVDCVRALAG
jgi:hypothetical protein